MGRDKKIKPMRVKRPADPERSRRLRRAFGKLFVFVAIVGAAGVAFARVWRHVERDIALPNEPLIVVVKNRPKWMSEYLVRAIADSVRPVGPHSAFDRQILVDTTHMLRANPWVREVYQVRRAYKYKPGDTLEIDCDFRAPVALVRYDNSYWLVDVEGTKLPGRIGPNDVPKVIFGDDGHTVFRVVEGVHFPPPAEAGKKWAGEDLATGLEMVRYLADRPYTEEILKVNVANFAGRRSARDPHIVLVTKYRSEIYWGRPPKDRDEGIIEVSTARKLQMLQATFEQFGRVDAKQPWIDIRYEDVLGVSPDPPPGPTTAAGTHKAKKPDGPAPQSRTRH